MTLPWNTALWFPALILLPLLAAPLVFLLGRRALPWLPLLAGLLIILTLVGLTAQIWETGPQRYAIGGWGAPLGIDLYADGLSLIMLWLTAGVGGLVNLYALHYFHDEPSKSALFWPLCLLLWAALNALFLAVLPSSSEDLGTDKYVPAPAHLTSKSCLMGFNPRRYARLILILLHSRPSWH